MTELENEPKNEVEPKQISEKVELKKLELAEQQRKDRASFALHLAMVKMAIKQPKKTHVVKVEGFNKYKKPFHYSYKYADLADVDKAIVDAIKVTAQDDKPLLTYYFDIDNGAEGVTVETVIVDAATGYSKRTNKVWFENVNVGDAQATAGLISYGKRYSLSAAFGIASEDDDDAQSQQLSQEPVIDKEAINIIFNDYINEHSQKAKNWIKGKHDKATGDYIKQLLGAYQLKHRLDDKKKAAVRKRKEKNEQLKEAVKSKPEDEATKAKKQEQINEQAAKIIDPPYTETKVDKEDPFASKKEGSSKLTQGQQDLFSDILGD